MKKIVLAALIITAFGCAGTLKKSWSKPGVDLATFTGDLESCIAAAKAAEKAVPTGYSDGSPAGSFGAGFARGMEQGKARRNAEEACFTRKGYTRIEMTGEEQKEFKAMKSKEEKIGFLHKVATK